MIVIDASSWIFSDHLLNLSPGDKSRQNFNVATFRSSQKISTFLVLFFGLEINSEWKGVFKSPVFTVLFQYGIYELVYHHLTCMQSYQTTYSLLPDVHLTLQEEWHGWPTERKILHLIWTATSSSFPSSFSSWSDDAYMTPPWQ